MSIDLRKFKKGTFTGAKNSRENHPILIFLRDHKEAFTAKEIVEATGQNEDSVRSMLRMLRRDKKVLHKTPYFVYAEHEELLDEN